MSSGGRPDFACMRENDLCVLFFKTVALAAPQGVVPPAVAPTIRAVMHQPTSSKVRRNRVDEVFDLKTKNRAGEVFESRMRLFEPGPSSRRRMVGPAGNGGRRRWTAWRQWKCAPAACPT